MQMPHRGREEDLPEVREYPPGPKEKERRPAEHRPRAERACGAESVTEDSDTAERVCHMILTKVPGPWRITEAEAAAGTAAQAETQTGNPTDAAVAAEADMSEVLPAEGCRAE